MADVIDMIVADHREVERLFEILRTQPDQRAIVFPTLSALLTAHSKAEESEVYPVAREEAGETEDVAHSQQEHAEAEQLLIRLGQIDPSSPEYDRTLRELVEGVTHHVEEEESKVLPGMRERLSEHRRHELADAFATAREQHLGEKPGESTREELLQQAKNAGIEGATTMSKDELKSALKP